MNPALTAEDLLPLKLNVAHKKEEDFPVGVSMLIRVPAVGNRYDKSMAVEVTRQKDHGQIFGNPYTIYTFNNMSCVEGQKWIRNIPLLVDKQMQFIAADNFEPLTEKELSAVVKDVQGVEWPLDMHAYFQEKKVFGTRALTSRGHVVQYLRAILTQCILPKILILKPVQAFAKPVAAFAKPSEAFAKPVAAIAKRKTVTWKEAVNSYDIFEAWSSLWKGGNKPVLIDKGVIQWRKKPFHLWLQPSASPHYPFTNLPVMVDVGTRNVYSAGSTTYAKAIQLALEQAYAEAKQQGTLPLDLHAFFVTSSFYKEDRYNTLPPHRVFRMWIDVLLKKEKAQEEKELVAVENTEGIPMEPSPFLPEETTMATASSSMPMELSPFLQEDTAMEIPLPPPPSMSKPLLKERLHLYVTKGVYGKQVVEDAYARLLVFQSRFNMVLRGIVSCQEDVIESMQECKEQVLPYTVFLEMSEEQKNGLCIAHNRLLECQSAVQQDKERLPLYHEKYSSAEDVYSKLYISFLQDCLLHREQAELAWRAFHSFPHAIRLYFAIWRVSSSDQEVVIQEF